MLAAEQALLEQALASLRRGDATGALARVAEHESRFSGGALVEEREVLAIRALVIEGRTDDARARAGRFRVRFPHSIQLDVIEAVLDKAR